MDTKTIVDYVKSVGLTGSLIAIIYLGYTGFWVFGSQLKDEQTRTATALAERDKWQQIALQGTKLAEDINVSKTSGGAVVVGAPLPVDASTDEVVRRLEQVKHKAFPGME